MCTHVHVLSSSYSAAWTERGGGVSVQDSNCKQAECSIQALLLQTLFRQYSTFEWLNGPARCDALLK